MREIKFRAKYKGKIYNVQTRLPKIMRSKQYKGWYKQQGYITRLITEHPHATKRGYVLEHRLVMEQHLGRFLKPNEEFVHHIDQNRSNNHITNLQLQGGQNWHAKGHLRGSRNPHGQFICNEPIFDEIKFRLLNTNTGLTTIYTLNKLIATTFRKGQFKFRGRCTGLTDKNGKESYRDDKISFGSIRPIYLIKWSICNASFYLESMDAQKECMSITNIIVGEIIGNIHQNRNLLDKD